MGSSKTLSFVLLGVCVGNCALVAAALGAGWLEAGGVSLSLFDVQGSAPSSLTGARACGVIAGILIYLQALIVIVASLSSKARFVHANVAGFVGAVFAIASFASWFSFFNMLIGASNLAGSWLMFISGLVALVTVGLGFKVNSKGSPASAPPAQRSAPPPNQGQQHFGQAPPPPPPMQEMPRLNTTTPVGGAATTSPNYNPFKPVDTHANQVQRV